MAYLVDTTFWGDWQMPRTNSIIEPSEPSWNCTDVVNCCTFLHKT